MLKVLVNTILILLVAGLTSCLHDGELKLENNGFVPVNKSDNWVISTPENENMDAGLLNKAYDLVYDDRRFLMARSLLVIRNGKLVAEAYPYDPADIDRIHNIQSCTKTFTSLMAGIALQKGHLDSLTQKLSDIYPGHFTGFEDKEDITLYDALSMRTGLEFNNDTNTLGLYQTEESSVEFVLSKDKLYEPGTVFHYNDGSPHLVSGAIQQGSGQSLGDYAGINLFEPLGIEEWMWEEASDGVTFGAFSLFLKPRDMAKVGQLLINKGMWDGQQLIDSIWIKKATDIQGSANFNGASYGLYFWVFPSYKGYAAEGHGGQILFVVPEKQLVIVYTAWPYTSSMLWDEYTNLVDLITASCK